MSRVDPNAFTQALLGGAAIGQRTIGLAQDQAGLLEHLRRNALQEQQDRETAQYLQTIFSGGQMPAGFDAGNVAPNAIQAGQEWQQEQKRRAAELELLHGINYGTDPYADPGPPDANVSPEAYRFGMGVRQDRIDARGWADQYALASGEGGQDFMGPQSPDVQAAYGMSSAALRPLVQETWEQRYKREKQDRRLEMLLASKHEIDDLALKHPEEWSQSQVDSAHAHIDMQLMDLESERGLPSDFFEGRGRGQNQPTAEDLVPVLMQEDPLLSEEGALAKARRFATIDRFGESVSRAILDPNRQVRELQGKRHEIAVEVAQRRLARAQRAIASIESGERKVGNEAYDRAMKAEDDAWIEYLNATDAQLEHYTEAESPASAAPAPPAAGQLGAPIDLSRAQTVARDNPPMEGETLEQWKARVRGLIRGAPR